MSNLTTIREHEQQRVTTKPKCTSALVIPTLNAGDQFDEWLNAFDCQTYRPDRLILIDSSSDDNTIAKAIRAGFEIRIIEREDFSHGGTRQHAIDLLDDIEIIIFLTQDAILTDSTALENLISEFEDSKVGCVYGRQIPRPEADPIETHARLFNYPMISQVRSQIDIPRYGIKTAFCSNSFGAYRRTALIEVGGFPIDTIQNEDTFSVSKMILNGWKVVYAANAAVFHSHHFNFRQEFQRYFDIGVFHARASWIRSEFGQAEGEGMRFVKSELSFLSRTKPTSIPSALARTALKLAGYKLGAIEAKIPNRIKKMLSSNKNFWAKENSAGKRTI